MPAGTYNLTIEQGADLDITFTWKDLLVLYSRLMTALLQAEETIRQQAEEIERLKKQGENGKTADDLAEMFAE